MFHHLLDVDQPDLVAAQRVQTAPMLLQTEVQPPAPPMQPSSNPSLMPRVGHGQQMRQKTVAARKQAIVDAQLCIVDVPTDTYISRTQNPAKTESK